MGQQVHIRGLALHVAQAQAGAMAAGILGSWVNFSSTN